MACEQVRAVLSELTECVETEQGTRFRTQCVYPSFDPVYVFVVRYGDGFKVHDGAGAARAGWDQGRDDIALVRKMLNRQAIAYGLSVVEDALVANISEQDGLLSGILAVANASATAAHAFEERAMIAAEDFLKERIYGVLSEVVENPKTIAKDYELRGKSGKKHHFDYAVLRAANKWMLLSAVAPHHVSVSAKYVSFADVREATDTISSRFIVHDRELETEDISLLQQVADIVPFKNLKKGVVRELRR